MKPGPAISTDVTPGSASSFGADQLGQRARIGPGALGQHHRRIGRQVAMRRIARRLDRDRLAVQAGGQLAASVKLIEDAVKQRGIAGVKGQFGSPNERISAPLAQE